MSQSTRVEVRRTSHVHQMPQTGRAHSGPVTSTTVQKTTPTSAVVSASISVSCSEKNFLMRKYSPTSATPVVATEDARAPAGTRLGIAYGATHVKTPIVIT